MADDPVLHWTEIDGVTTVWVDAQRPLTAALLFRGGHAHETLTTSGHTHLLEHMALSATSWPPDRTGGSVAGAFTEFGTTDSPEAVCAFLLGLCRALRSLPGDRLESEKQILSAESSSRARSFVDSLLVWRYGAAGYGLFGMPEYGLRDATLAQLHSLAAERFTAENAVLWLSGPPPAGLRLDLPHGTKLAPPALKPIVPSFPSWFRLDASGGVVASAMVPRVSASPLFNLIAQKRLLQQLRMEKALSYAPSLSYEPLDGETAHLVFYADSNEERRGELVDAFADYFDKLVDIDEAELQAARTQIIEYWSGPLAAPPAERAAAEAQRAAMDWVLGMEHESLEELAAGYEAVTPADNAEFRRAVFGTALFALPGDPARRPLDAKPAPLSVIPPVEGRQIANKDSPVDTTRLVHGPDGLTALLTDGSSVTVRYAELAAALSYQDGAVVLIGADAVSIPMEPTLWHDGPRVGREIRERVPSHLLLDRGARPAAAIPKPETTLWQRVIARITPNRQRLT